MPEVRSESRVAIAKAVRSTIAGARVIIGTLLTMKQGGNERMQMLQHELLYSCAAERSQAITLSQC